MALVLAIEPDFRQAEILKRVIRQQVQADLVVVESRDAAIAALSACVPDVVLLTALLSPRDEEELVTHLRTLAGGEHIQTHTIPQLASTSSDPEVRATSVGGLLSKFRKSKKRVAEPIPGCDPSLFAEEVSAFLLRAAEVRAQATLAPLVVPQRPAETREAAAAEPVLDEVTDPSSAWASPFEWRRAESPIQETAHTQEPPPSSLVLNAPLAVLAEEEEQRRAAGVAAERERQESERARLEAEDRERERQRLEAEAVAEEERRWVEAEAEAERERLRLDAEAEAAAEHERLRLEAEAAERERERLRLDAEAAAERERLRLEAEAAERERERLRLEAEAAAERERLRLEAEAAERERERLRLEAAAAERERLRLEAEAAAAHERRRIEAEAAAERERRRLEAEAAAERERLRLEAEAAAAQERRRIEAEAAAERERRRLEAEAAAERERLRLEAEAADRERERLRLEAAAVAAAERERLRLELEAAAERERIRLELEAAAERERQRLEAEAAAERERLWLEVEAARQREADLAREAETAALLAAAEAEKAAADPFADFRLDENAGHGVLRLMPLALWASREAAPAAPVVQVPGGELRELMAGLALPPHVADVAYARGCRIRRVRVTALPAAARTKSTQPVILSKRALDEMRAKE